jgi:hypothetical protein
MALLSRKARSGSLLVAELRLLLKEQRWWWYLIAGLLFIAGFFAPPESARQVLLPLAWLWPMLLWSSLGSREAVAQTHQFVFSCVQPLWRQLPITWGVGVLIALGTAGGVAGQFTLAGNWEGLFALLVGALFIPSLALASGVWSGNSKLFEVAYLSLWYLGVVQHVTPLDFMGVTAGAVAFHVSAVYLLITLSLLVIAVFGRLRQLHL